MSLSNQINVVKGFDLGRTNHIDFVDKVHSRNRYTNVDSRAKGCRRRFDVGKVADEIGDLEIVASRLNLDLTAKDRATIDRDRIIDIRLGRSGGSSGNAGSGGKQIRTWTQPDITLCSDLDVATTIDQGCGTDVDVRLRVTTESR